MDTFVDYLKTFSILSHLVYYLEKNKIKQQKNTFSLDKTYSFSFFFKPRVQTHE